MTIAVTTSPRSPVSPLREISIRSGRTAYLVPLCSMKFVSPMKSATKRVAGAS
jgi:hypothetical protein